MADFGSAPGTTARRSKSAESFGIVTVELPNGMRLDGYTLLSAKNAGKLGISAEKLAELVAAKSKAVIGAEGSVRLHIQFGDKDVAVSAPVEMTFV